MKRVMSAIAAPIAASMLIGAAVLAAPGIAEARFGAGAIAEPTASSPATQPAHDYSGQRRSRRYTPPRTYTPPRSNNAPPYIYPGSRNALDTCAFC